MDLFESIQQQAMLAVIDPDDDAFLRRAFRYYSKKFATPLHLVPQVPLDDVLTAFFEDVFGDMDEETRDERIEWLLATPKEREEMADMEKTLAARDDAFFKNLNAEVAKGEQKAAEKGKPILVDRHGKPLPSAEALTPLARRIQRVRERAQKMAGTSLPTGPTLGSTGKLGAVKVPPEPAMLGELPEFRMDFGSPPPPKEPDRGNLPGTQQWDDLDPLAPPRKPKK